MGGKHLKLRTIVIVAIIAVFAFSIYPLAPRDFYETFFKALKVKDDAVAAELVSDAKQLQAGRPDLNQAAALLEAAEAKKVDLVPLVSGRNLAGNADVIAMVRKEASGSIRLGLDLNGGVEFPTRSCSPDSRRAAPPPTARRWKSRSPRNSTATANRRSRPCASGSNRRISSSRTSRRSERVRCR